MNRRPPFHRLIDRHGRTLWAYFMAATGSKETASDLTQETFLQAFRGWKRFRGESKPFTWLYAIARKILARHYRRAGVERRAEERLKSEAAGSCPGDSSDEERGFMIRQAVSQLSEPFREAILLHYFADLSVARIAESLGIPEGTVKSRLARGRKILNRMWEQV